MVVIGLNNVELDLLGSLYKKVYIDLLERVVTNLLSS